MGILLGLETADVCVCVCIGIVCMFVLRSECVGSLLGLGIRRGVCVCVCGGIVCMYVVRSACMGIKNSEVC